MTETGKYVKHMTKLSKRPQVVEKTAKVTTVSKRPKTVEKQAPNITTVSKRPKKK